MAERRFWRLPDNRAHGKLVNSFIFKGKGLASKLLLAYVALDVAEAGANDANETRGRNVPQT
jgi:hypothetical protein